MRNILLRAFIAVCVVVPSVVMFVITTVMFWSEEWNPVYLGMSMNNLFIAGWTLTITLWLGTALAVEAMEA